MGKYETLNLMEMTALNVQEYLERDDIVLIPTGSNERHGRHLPVGEESPVQILGGSCLLSGTNLIGILAAGEPAYRSSHFPRGKSCLLGFLPDANSRLHPQSG